MPVIDVRDGKIKGSPKKNGKGNYWNYAGMTLFVSTDEETGEIEYSVTVAMAPDHPIRFYPRQQQPKHDGQIRQEGKPF